MDLIIVGFQGLLMVFFVGSAIAKTELEKKGVTANRIFLTGDTY